MAGCQDRLGRKTRFYQVLVLVMQLCLAGNTEGSVLDLALAVVARCLRKVVASVAAEVAAVTAAVTVRLQRIDQVQKHCLAPPQTEHQVEAPYHTLLALLDADPALARRWCSHRHRK